MSLLQALIPDNITTALVQNFVPAIVFAVIFGIAIQSIPAKASFLQVVDVVRRASLQIWAWVVYLASGPLLDQGRSARKPRTTLESPR